MLGGYAGRILYVDLEKKELCVRDLDEKLARKYIGGAGLAAKIIWDETDSGTDGFSPENLLVFMAGPLTGTAVPSSSRYIVAAISPLTGIWGQAHSGGTWGDELKHAGFDGIIFKGKADRPVYLWVNNGTAQLRDAGHLWGKDTYEATDLIQQETDKKASVAVIGQAGEKMVRIACIMNDGRAGRAAARCGLGAVMGSKNIKAVVVRGHLRPQINDETEFRESISRYFPPTGLDEDTRREKATIRWREMWSLGRAAVKNYQEGEFDSFRDKFVERIVGGEPYFCRRCRTSCIESRMEGGVRHSVWEVMVPLGSQCLIDDMDAIAAAYDLCNRYGVDSISTGGVIAFAMEAYEKGLITGRDTGGIGLNFGDSKAMIQMVKQIGEKEGFGEVLGWGSREAAKHIGGEAGEYAMQVKGLEVPAHDPRVSNAIALEYATSNIGAWHCSAKGNAISRNFSIPDIGVAPTDPFTVKGVGTTIAKMQDWMCLLDSLSCCKFTFMASPTYLPRERALQPSHYLEWLNLATGWNMSLPEFLKCGERICNLQRMINVRRGISRKDDTLPARLLTHQRGGRSEGAKNLPPLGAMLTEYYLYRGWNEDGIPPEEKLTDLGL